MQCVIERKQGQDHIEVIANFLWQLWKGRNEKQFKGTIRDSPVISGLVVVEWGEFKEAAMGVTQKKKQRFVAANEALGWKPLEENQILINTDASIDVHRSKGGLGLVARNNSGKLMAVWAVALDQSGEIS
ncbi:hypothetical protein ACH5RR_004192 [Cinchona calisaya]|uniref:RNase H type-1 domain-containing protein n=1 Tax=Cinchona calisaya TaxID=153742 RepID=A0ABD3AXB8_9GENT